MQDLLIPRKKYIQTTEQISNCPECNSLLSKEDSIVLLYGKSDIDEGEFMTNASGSYFCPICPTVVFEKEVIEKTVTLSLRKNKWFECDVLALVDLGAVPDDKKHLPFGGDDNPIPIVEFLSEKTIKISKPQIKNIEHKEKAGRNEACPCGSGKKYKKCCL
jgi:hypothetical protein